MAAVVLALAGFARADDKKPEKTPLHREGNVEWDVDVFEQRGSSFAVVTRGQTEPGKLGPRKQSRPRHGDYLRLLERIFRRRRDQALHSGDRNRTRIAQHAQRGAQSVYPESAEGRAVEERPEGGYNERIMQLTRLP